VRRFCKEAEENAAFLCFGSTGVSTVVLSGELLKEKARVGAAKSSSEMTVLLVYCLSQNPSEPRGSALCVLDEDFTGSTGCCGPPYKESRTLSGCQVPLVLSFILAEVLLTFGLWFFRELPRSQLSPRIIPSGIHHPEPAQALKELHCTLDCFSSCFKYFLHL